MKLQVVYETDAGSNMGSFTNAATLRTKTVWGNLEDNLKKIFTNRVQSVSFSIPNSISSMQSISSHNKSNWTNRELLSFAKSYRKATYTADTGRFFLAHF